jgi:hypothetical protein
MIKTATRLTTTTTTGKPICHRGVDTIVTNHHMGGIRKHKLTEALEVRTASSHTKIVAAVLV